MLRSSRTTSTKLRCLRLDWVAIYLLDERLAFLHANSAGTSIADASPRETLDAEQTRDRRRSLLAGVLGVVVRRTDRQPAGQHAMGHHRPHRRRDHGLDRRASRPCSSAAIAKAIGCGRSPNSFIRNAATRRRGSSGRKPTHQMDELIAVAAARRSRRTRPGALQRVGPQRSASTTRFPKGSSRHLTSGSPISIFATHPT